MQLEHLDLIEYVVVDLLKVKWKSFVRREFFIQMFLFTIYFMLGPVKAMLPIDSLTFKSTLQIQNLVANGRTGMFTYLYRPIPAGQCVAEESDNSTSLEPELLLSNISLGGNTSWVTECEEGAELEVAASRTDGLAMIVLCKPVYCRSLQGWAAATCTLQTRYFSRSASAWSWQSPSCPFSILSRCGLKPRVGRTV